MAKQRLDQIAPREKDRCQICVWYVWSKSTIQYSSRKPLDKCWLSYFLVFPRAYETLFNFICVYMHRTHACMLLYVITLVRVYDSYHKYFIECNLGAIHSSITNCSQLLSYQFFVSISTAKYMVWLNESKFQWSCMVWLEKEKESISWVQCGSFFA